MAKAFLLSFQLHIEPTTPLYGKFHAKTQASKKSQTHELRIIRHSSSSNTASVDLRRTRRVKGSVSPAKRLLSYVSSGCLEPALQLFEEMTKSSTFVWNVMIRGLVDSGMFEEAIELYCRMQFERIKADKFTFPFVVKACAGAFGSKEGQSVHAAVIKLGFDVDIYICNALIAMYAKVGCIEDAEKVFGRMLVRDLVSWNSMISGYVSSGDGLSSLVCVRKMQKSGLEPDRFSYISAVGACALERNLLIGKEIFRQVLRNGLELDSMIQSSLIDMFGKCGEVDYAERFFNRISQKNIVVWNAMIGAYAMNDKSFESFACLKKMQDGDNLTPDVVTLINLLPSVSKLRALLQGKAVHGHAIRKGYLSHLVLETALVDMYGNCGTINLGEFVFFRIKEKNLVSWNAMIAAYVQNLKNREALESFQILQKEHCIPDEMTFVSVLAAYAEIAFPKQGKQIHCHITKLGFSSGTFVSNALIHMYAKCGDIESARKVFNSLLFFKDIITWNTIIMACAIHGFGTYCFKLFDDMINEGYKPNESTFVSILSACSIAGILDDGLKYFDLMKRDYGLDPGIEHYGCIVDLLGRAGNLNRAKSFIEEMPLKPTARIWGSLLAASRFHKNIEMAEMAGAHIFSLDNDNTGYYVLLSNMYAEFGRWDDVKHVKHLMKQKGFDRTIGISTVECNGKAYNFRNYDKSHTESNNIYYVLDILSRKLGEDVYSCSVSKFKPPKLIKTRGKSPMFHSVRLAICSGLIGTCAGNPVVIRKNVRICEDCHRATKKISQVTNREIVVGDSKIYHRFKDGRCSCGDYW